MRIQDTVFIDLPIEDVFEYLTTYENEAKWQSSIVEARVTSEGPMDLGTTGLEVRNFFGRRIESE
ncbi:MAG: SRPBCC family protein [Anaerolineaceae bacterium]|nr:MAG: SRPBCC family protein [Anaerolineaceae bacterium]